MLGLLALASPVHAQSIPNQAAIDEAIRQELANDPLTASVKKSLQSVVAITILTETMRGAASGVVLTKNGLILTNKHVVANSKALYVVTLPDGTQKVAKIWYRDPVQDFALIKIDSKFKNVATLGASSKLTLGQRVAAIGNAHGLNKNAISAGVIFAIDTKIHAKTVSGSVEENLSGLIVTTAPITVGYSGGPVVTTNGTVIGLNVATDGVRGYAIPIDEIKTKIKGYLQSVY
ncbi:MAG: putative family peptidase [Candidatus Paceibacter sp.]|nr:putative family peptidase [Candidatus Paceibacter sp.]